jgi:hypothetical protein
MFQVGATEEEEEEEVYYEALFKRQDVRFTLTYETFHIMKAGMYS